jgi:hypothetical protein
MSAVIATRFFFDFVQVYSTVKCAIDIGKSLAISKGVGGSREPKSGAATTPSLNLPISDIQLIIAAKASPYFFS